VVDDPTDLSKSCRLLTPLENELPILVILADFWSSFSIVGPSGSNFLVPVLSRGGQKCPTVVNEKSQLN